MSIINTTTLNKILKNLKNRIISINKSKLENGSKIRIIIEGIFQRKEKIIKPTLEWFKDWSKDFENKIIKTFNNIEQRLNKIEGRLDKVERRLDKIEERLDKIEGRLDKIEKDIVDIKNCPTIKKELALS